MAEFPKDNIDCIKKYKNMSTLDFLISKKSVEGDYAECISNAINFEISAINKKFSSPIKNDAIRALQDGYFCASNGIVSGAFENSRFFMERLSLLKIISCTGDNNPYEAALAKREWHLLINDKFIIYSASQFIGRLNHYFGKNFDKDNISVYAAGMPLCEAHSKAFKDYSMGIKDIEKKYGICIDEKCSKCNKKAVKFIIALPKAGAIIGMLGFFTGKDTKELGRLYADYSRILHPYGFYSYKKEHLFNLWAVDMIRLIETINKYVF